MQSKKAEQIAAAIPDQTQPSPTWRARLWAILPWAVFVAASIIQVVGLICHYRIGLDDDISSELVLAKTLADSKGFVLTDQWFYSTEIRFLNTQLVFAPLFWLTNNWMVVRLLGTIILLAIMLLAFYFLLAALQQKVMFPWLATFLLLPLSGYQIYVINYGVFYIPHVTVSFLVLGLLFYAVRAVGRHYYWFLGGGVHSFVADRGRRLSANCNSEPTIIFGRKCLCLI